MIWKLLKYDVRGIGKKLVPLYVLALGFSLLTRLTFTSYIYSPEVYSYDVPLWAETIMGLTMGITWIMVGAVFVVTFFMLVGKYFRSIYGDEGYLINTLPITKHQIIISKVLNFYLWHAIAVIVSILCIVVMFFHADIWNEFRHFFIDEIWQELVHYITSEHITAGIIFFISAIIAPAASALLIFLCAGIGSRFRHKLTMGVVAYMVISFIVSTISQIIMTISFTDYFYTDTFPILGFSIYSLTITVIQLIVYYLITHHMLTSQLNLE